MSSVILTMCAVVMACCGIFGTLYDPGHPWLDRKRKVGVAALCIAGVVALATIVVSNI